ncbi:LOW QUALITY PROTEIN: hypothetical protein OSB04_025264 [Centaurea solstitialis]|uniref:DUF1985 domain-containing protein n=1 Tax=Centaurea solstitialis TaxID=347529 RepID=A0AA38W1J5_9ASTR|nr:LOW QUALITY PROTEIN: hypothetical protein OSB04_025264 [Centaurea solstitialis]
MSQKDVVGFNGGGSGGSGEVPGFNGGGGEVVGFNGGGGRNERDESYGCIRGDQHPKPSSSNKSTTSQHPLPPPTTFKPPSTTIHHRFFLNFEWRYEASYVTLRSQMRLLSEVKKNWKTNQLRYNCFDQPFLVLDIKETYGDSLLIDTIIKHQISSPPNADQLLYLVDNNFLSFKKSDFCLITGFKFGNENNPPHNQTASIIERLFDGDYSARSLKVSDLYSIFQNYFHLLSDGDAVRVGLLIVLDLVFLGRQKDFVHQDWCLQLVEDLDSWNAYPWGSLLWRKTFEQLNNAYLKRKKDNNECKKYTLSGFIYAFKIWILETFPQSTRFFHRERTIPRAIGWRRLRRTSTEYCHAFMSFEWRPFAYVSALAYWISFSLCIFHHFSLSIFSNIPPAAVEVVVTEVVVAAAVPVAGDEKGAVAVATTTRRDGGRDGGGGGGGGSGDGGSGGRRRERDEK